jgi:FMN phosphatase YigB (HAD superfamily)
MTEITHILFDLHHTIVDSHKMKHNYAKGLGQLMSERYGLTPEAWVGANLKVMADYDSYYADLDLGAENGLKQAWEATFRMTRALFRLTNTPEPDFDDLWALVRAIPGQAPRYGDSFYPDVHPVLEYLHAQGYTLGTATHAYTAQAEAALIGAGVRHLFMLQAIIGADTIGMVFKETDYLHEVTRILSVPAESILLVDDKAWIIANAKRVGMRGVQIDRQRDQASAGVITTLAQLNAYL